MTFYTIAYGGNEQSLAAWGVRADCAWRFANKERDTLTLNTVEAFDPSAAQFAWGRPLALYAGRSASGGGYSGGTLVFQGYVGELRMSAEGGRQAIGYAVHGPWWLLQRLQFKQTRQVFAGWVDGPGTPASGAVLTAVVTAETFLGEDPTQAMWTGAQQITEILNWANECWNPTRRGATSGIDATQDILQIGTLDCGQIFPKTRANTVSCAEAIVQVLRYFPATVCWFDYTTSPPTLNVRDLANLAGVAETITANQEREISLAPQYERELAGVMLTYKQVTVTDGVPWPSLYVDKYPPVITDYTPNVVSHVIDIPGWKVNTMKATVATLPFYGSDAFSSTPATAGGWWLAIDKSLQDPLIKPASIQCGAPIGIKDANGNAVDAASYPNILLPSQPGQPSGPLSSWMAGVRWMEATIQVQQTFTKYHDGGSFLVAPTTVSNRLVAYKVMLTNAATGTYTGSQLADTGEAVPPCYPTAGSLAQAAYTSASSLQWQGRITFLDAVLRSGIGVVNRLTLAGPNNTYRNLLVQAVECRPHYGEMRVEFGPSARIDAGLLVEMWRASRWRTTYNLPSGRSSGQGSITASIDQSGDGGKSDTAHGLGTHQVQSLSFDQGTGASGPNGVTVIQHDASGEAISIQRVDPATGAGMAADGNGNALGSVTLALGATGGKAIAIQTMSDGSKVVASPDFTGGGGSSVGLYYFLGFAVPAGAPVGSGQITLNGSPNGTLQTLIVACAWQANWTTTDHPPASQPKVYIALPEHLRDVIASELVPDLTGPATSGEVTYSGYSFSAQPGGAGFDQYRTATPPSGSGLPVEQQFITPPYKVGDFLWAATVPATDTNINIQATSGDPVTAAAVAAGGTGYRVGDAISVSGGTGTAPAFTVSAISGGGSSGPMTAVTVLTGGALSAAVNPLAVTGGSGSGAALDLTFGAITVIDTNRAARAWGD